MLLRRFWLSSSTILRLAQPTRSQDLFPNSPIQQAIQLSSTLSTNMTRGAVIALSHGGGPMPILGDPSHKDIVSSLKTRVPEILRLNKPDRPRAIVVVTAHWSERNPTISNGQKHKLYYDYHGFPPETYKLKYDAPGSPEVAKEVYEALEKAGLKPENDEERGWDHGVFIPLLLIHPAADIPVIQLSVLTSEDPAQHYRMGAALAALRDSNIAIIGSGFASFHNLRILFSGTLTNPPFVEKSKKWNKAVTEAVVAENTEEREKKLEGWRDFHASYEMHPRGGAEHFLPLIVCAAAGGDGVAGQYVDEFMGLDIYSYYWN